MREFMRNKKEHLDEKATARFEPMPGQPGQIDWAFFEDYLVLEGGKMKKLYCFLIVLGYSRMRYTKRDWLAERVPVVQHETGGHQAAAETGG
ncbi:MAG: hypothetical protein LUG13_10030 [Oscillospiraceae bacterium]|nr:hypothetical protein [Oscillospiraceae bacterium]